MDVALTIMLKPSGNYYITLNWNAVIKVNHTSKYQRALNLQAEASRFGMYISTIQKHHSSCHCKKYSVTEFISTTKKINDFY